MIENDYDVLIPCVVCSYLVPENKVVVCGCDLPSHDRGEYVYCSEDCMVLEGHSYVTGKSRSS